MGAHLPPHGFSDGPDPMDTMHDEYAAAITRAKSEGRAEAFRTCAEETRSLLENVSFDVEVERELEQLAERFDAQAKAQESPKGEVA